MNLPIQLMTCIYNLLNNLAPSHATLGCRVPEEGDGIKRTPAQLQAGETSSGEWLLSSKSELRDKYDFILLASVTNDLELPDIGHNRPAIVSEALRNLLLVSYFLMLPLISPDS